MKCLDLMTDKALFRKAKELRDYKKLPTPYDQELARRQSLTQKEATDETATPDTEKEVVRHDRGWRKARRVPRNQTLLEQAVTRKAVRRHTVSQRVQQKCAEDDGRT
jgi:hypothetical protein